MSLYISVRSVLFGILLGLGFELELEFELGTGIESRVILNCELMISNNLNKSTPKITTNKIK